MGLSSSVFSSSYFGPAPRSMPVPLQISGVFESGIQEQPRHASDFYDYLIDRSDTLHPRLYHLQECKITTVEYRKCKNAPEHEFLVIFVNYHVDTIEQKAFFRVERSVKPETLVHKSGIVGLGHSSATVSGSSTPSLISAPALDYVGRHHTHEAALGKDKSRICFTVSFSHDNCPNIINLVSAVSTVHEIYSDYVLWKYTCYWFAFHVCYLLMHEQTASLKAGDCKAKPGSFMGLQVLQSKGTLAVCAAQAAEEAEKKKKQSVLTFKQQSAQPPAITVEDIAACHNQPEVWDVDAAGPVEGVYNQDKAQLSHPSRPEFVNRYKGRYEEAVRMIQRRDEEMVTAEQLVAAANASLARAEAKVAQLEAENAQLKGRTMQLETQVDQFREMLEQQRKDISELMQRSK